MKYYSTSHPCIHSRNTHKKACWCAGKELLKIVQISVEPRSYCLRQFTGCMMIRGFPWWLSGKESACQCRRCGFDPCIRKIPWKRKRQPTPVFLPGKYHGQRSLAGYSPWGHKRIGHNLVTNTTEWLKNCKLNYYPYFFSSLRILILYILNKPI